MVNSFSDFDEMHKSFLQEIGNMGAGTAATDVSNMISAPTDISTPQVRITPAIVAGKVADMMTAKAEAFRINFCGDIKGSVLFVFPYASIERLAKPFFPDISIKSKGDIDEMTTSAVRETVNIAAASYAKTMAMMSDVNVDISVPEAAEPPSADIKGDANNIVCSVKNTIEFTDTHCTFEVLFYPEIDSIRAFMEKNGLIC